MKEAFRTRFTSFLLAGQTLWSESPLLCVFPVRTIHRLTTTKRSSFNHRANKDLEGEPKIWKENVVPWIEWARQFRKTARPDGPIPAGGSRRWRNLWRSVQSFRPWTGLVDWMLYTELVLFCLVLFGFVLLSLRLRSVQLPYWRMLYPVTCATNSSRDEDWNESLRRALAQI